MWCIAGRPDVEANVYSTGYPRELFRFVEGDVCNSLYDDAPSTIALLRLDTDWYESTRVEMEVLYPRLSHHGVCIFDDFGHWAGARRAVEEYFASSPPRPLLGRIDYTGRLMIKTTP